MFLIAIKQSIKGQSQEIVLHMGESASVTDILVLTQDDSWQCELTCFTGQVLFY